MAGLTRRFLPNDQTPDDGQASASGWDWFDASLASDSDWFPEWATAAAVSSRTEVEPAPGFGGSLLASTQSQGSNASPSAGSATKKTSQSSNASSSASSPPNGTSQDAALATNIAKYLQNGSLSYNSVLTILEDAVVGGMTASNFAALQSFASELNASGGVSVSPYVEQIADDVIEGNSANATWNGGASTATRLGDLSATSSQT